MDTRIGSTEPVSNNRLTPLAVISRLIRYKHAPNVAPFAAPASTVDARGTRRLGSSGSAGRPPYAQHQTYGFPLRLMRAGPTGRRGGTSAGTSGNASARRRRRRRTRRTARPRCAAPDAWRRGPAARARNWRTCAGPAVPAPCRTAYTSRRLPARRSGDARRPDRTPTNRTTRTAR